ncbi:MAG: IMP dehydrogenase, partial [Rhodopila sp.]|nr:IMP dehydrogenase [Rhodopila sp.]
MALDIPQQTLPSSSRAEVVASRVEEALAFDDVLVVPAYSQVLPSSTSTVTRL